MKRLGFETETALNGEQAVEKLSKTDYELIVMDCQMPVMDGYETTEQIREREKAAGTRAKSIGYYCVHREWIRV